MPGVMVLISEGVPLDTTPHLQRRRWETVISLTTEELRQAAREGKLEELLVLAARKVKLRRGEKVIGYGFTGRGLSKLGVPTEVYWPDEVENFARAQDRGDG